MSIVALLEVVMDPHRLQYDLQQEKVVDQHPIINQPDRVVLEYGKRLAEELTVARERQTELVVVVVGGEEEQHLLDTLPLVGVTRIIWLDLPYSPITEPLQRARAISEVIQSFTPELILCSEQQVDGAHSFTGGWLAELLQYNHLGGVEKVEVSSTLQSLLVQTMVQKGTKGIFQVALPAILSIRKGTAPLYIPRLSNLHLQSRKIEIHQIKISSEPQDSSTFSFTAFSEVKPRTKTASGSIGAVGGTAGATRNPLAARMKAMMGGRGSEQKETTNKMILTDSAETAAQVLLQKIAEWRKEN